MSADHREDSRLENAWWWLGLAAVLLLFANGRHTVALAAWLAPVFLLRFLRLRSFWRGVPFAWLVLAATWSFQFREMAPLPGVWYYVLAASYGLVELAPFAVDRLLAGKVHGFGTTLVLPCAWVAIDFANAALSPYGSWGSVAYSQHESLVLLQLVSLTGLFGVTFLIAWAAAVVNWVWELEPAWDRARRGLLAFVGVVAAVSAFGGVRLALFPPSGPTVRVASLSRSDIGLFATPDVARRASGGGTLTAAELEDIRGRAETLNNDLLERSEVEAIAGAKIVFWGESNGFVFKEDEPALIARAAELARAHSIYLGMGLGTWEKGAERPLENKLLFLDPEGEVLFESWKAIPVPGPEAAMSARDNGLLESAETPFGRVGEAICFDMDFPLLLRQAGRQGVDLLLVPSNDWREIDPWHTHMARFRAVEQGFNLVRHASQGLSLAADYQGRPLAAMDHFATHDRALVAHVPTRGVRTVYSRTGDILPWICLLGLLALAITAQRAANAGKRSPDGA